MQEVGWGVSVSHAGSGMGSKCLVETEFGFGKMKRSWRSAA